MNHFLRVGYMSVYWPWYQPLGPRVLVRLTSCSIQDVAVQAPGVANQYHCLTVQYPDAAAQLPDVAVQYLCVAIQYPYVAV